MIHCAPLAFVASLFVLLVHADVFTFYNDAGYGACGTRINAATQLLAAVSHTQWTSSNPKNDPLCKKCVRVTYKGKTIKVPIKDKCRGCAANHVDLSTPAYKQLEPSTDIGSPKDTTIKIVDCGEISPAPAPAPSGGCKRTYVVKSGDTCWKVWTNAKITESKFRSFNPNVQQPADSMPFLKIGTKLCTA